MFEFKEKNYKRAQEVIEIDSDPSPIDFNLNILTSDQKFVVLQKCGHEGLQDLDDFPLDVKFMLNKIQSLSDEEAVELLREVLVVHLDDVNFPVEDYESIIQLLSLAPEYILSEGLSIDILEARKSIDETTEPHPPFPPIEKVPSLDWSFEVRLYASLIAFHSPYPEVRALTDPFDNTTIPVETFRVYFLAFFWTIIGSGINEFFGHRQPSISLDNSIIQLFLYPCGTIWHKIVPCWGITFRGRKYAINIESPWTYKEQMFATIVYSASSANPYVDSNIYVQKLDLFYGNKWANFGYQTLLILSTQFLGFGFAGIMRKICVYPTRALWPTLLPAVALNRALLSPERKENINGWTISRYSFFLTVFAASFIYLWIPNYLFTALTYFNWMTWIKPQNFNLAAITGSLYGLGLNPVPSFNWNIINMNGCLAIPFYSQLNQYIGTFIAFFAIIGVYWSNYKWTGYLPINSNSLFSNTGEYYSVSDIITNNLFDKAKYEQVGPPFYSAAALVLYGAFFAIYPFSVIYTCYYEWRSIKFSLIEVYRSFRYWRRSNFENFKDPHSVMMSKYKEVPDWAFLIILIISFVLAVLCVELYPTSTPVWSLVFAIGINFVFLIPITVIYAVTGFSFGLNVLVELIVGYALPGNGMALMIIKAFGYNIDGQAQNYISDQKCAHYAKVPPRAIFRGQLISTLINCFVCLGVINWQLTNIEDICSETQHQSFTCPGDRTFYSSSILWGIIGPKKVFNGLYPILKYCFLIGVLLPIPCILFKKYGPKRISRYFQPTLIIGGMLIYAPYNLSYITGGIYLSYVFMHLIRRKYLPWWEKYNYILTAGLSAGVALSAIIIFFAVEYHAKNVVWWGNTVSYLGVEGNYGQQSYFNISSAPDGYFGPRFGDFP